MKTSSTTLKVRQIINLVRDGKLIPRPEFQRRLVWKASDKNHFLDTILRGYPFPEIYIADGEVNLESGEGTQLLVDGLQRVSTITEYFSGDPELKLISIPPYSDLSSEKKTAFLQYDVAVRDMGSVTTDQIVEAFRRINATDYSLTDIEVNNARYRGEMKELAENISRCDIFERHKVFNSLDYRRMGDLRFSLTIIISVMGGYFNRDDEFERYLESYNENFEEKDSIYTSLIEVFNFIEECGFGRRSRVWRKADLLTLIVEIYSALIDESIPLEPSHVIDVLQGFYSEVDIQEIGSFNLSGLYYKAALQASNDRLNRLRRGIIIGGLLRSEDRDAILAKVESFSPS